MIIEYDAISETNDAEDIVEFKQAHTELIEYHKEECPEYKFELVFLRRDGLIFVGLDMPDNTPLNIVFEIGHTIGFEKRHGTI